MMFRRLLILLATGFLLSGCLTSPNPFYADADIIQDDRILADYRETPRGDGSQEGFIVERNNDQAGRYRLRHTEGRYWMTFTATLFRIGDNTFLDIYPESDSGVYRVPGGPPTGTEILRGLTYQPLHLVARVTISDEGLGFSVIKPKGLRVLVDRDPSLRQYVRGESLLLPMATADLRKLLEKLADDEMVFPKPQKLQKSKLIK
jgi:hypothetical protein